MGFFCAQTGRSHAKELLEALNARESAMTTGIIEGVAIPHARTQFVKEMCGAIAIAKNGIDYGSMDGNPVKLAFMFFAPNSFSNQYLRMMNRLAKLLDSRDFINEISAADTAEKAWKILNARERLLVEGNFADD